MAEESFLSRWSRRKLDNRADKPSGDSPQRLTPLSATVQPATCHAQQALPPPAPPAAAQCGVEVPPAMTGIPQSSITPVVEEAGQAAESGLPLPDTLTPDADFRPFMRPDVDPALRNQAMKMLFKDPHFNVMDMMDVYVDDYTQPDPIPESMLHSMTQSRMLGLFDEKEAAKEGKAGERDGSRDEQGNVETNGQGETELERAERAAAAESDAPVEVDTQAPTDTDFPVESGSGSRTTLDAASGAMGPGDRGAAVP